MQGAIWKKIRCSSLFLEFSWLPYNRAKPLRSVVNTSPESLARHCWKEKINPISPRHGLFLQKPLHKALNRLASEGAQKESERRLVSYYRQRVLGDEVCRQLAPLMEKKEGLDLVAAITQRLRSNADNDGYGDLSIKIASKLWQPADCYRA